jgi:hypothetical protein
MLYINIIKLLYTQAKFSSLKDQQATRQTGQASPANSSDEHYQQIFPMDRLSQKNENTFKTKWYFMKGLCIEFLLKWKNGVKNHRPSW